MDITAPIKPPEQKRKSRRGGFLLRFFGFLFAAGMIVFVAVGAVAAFVLWKVSEELPEYEVLAKYEPPVMTRIHANDGNLIAEFARERRIYVPFTAIPPLVVEAFLSAEDKNFYQHSGVDIQGIMRAAITNLGGSGGRKVGASTITQQVAKNFLLTTDQTMERKLKEVILSIRIERAFTKEQILELYLNEIYLGGGAYGIAAAAQTYWDKSLTELSIADCAYLATLPKAPSTYNPFRNPERAIERRNWVIDRMVENRFISAAESEEAKASPLGVQVRRTGARLSASEYFAEEVRRDIIDLFGEDKLYGGGLSVRTTLDPKLQQIARKVLIDGFMAYDHRHGYRGVADRIDLEDWSKQLAAIKVWSDIAPWRLAVVLEANKDQAVVGLRPLRTPSGGLSEPETGIVPFSTAKWARPKLKNGMGASPRVLTDVIKPGDVIYVAPREPTEEESDVKGQWSLEQVPAVSGAIVVMDPHTGRVLALVGGFSFLESQFDRAVQARRQPGSSFKPLIYTTALDNGYMPTSIIVDGPICISQGAGMPKWCPKNYEAGKSAGPSTLRAGIEKSRNLMTVRLSNDMGMPIIVEYARRFGVYDNLMPVLSMALGAGETTLLRMVGAYGMIANGGKQIKPTLIDRVQDRYGRTIWRHDMRDCSSCGAREWSNQAEPELVDDRAQIIDPMSAFQMVSIMEGVVQRGTAQKLKVLERPIAGKTGTTNDEKDAWFIGYTPDLVVGVYVGFDNPSPMGHGETGGNVSAPVVRDFFKIALADQPPIPFRVPADMKLVPVNPKTGLPAAPGDASAIMEAFKPSQMPADMVADGKEELIGDQALGGEVQSEQGHAGPAPSPGLTQTPSPSAVTSNRPATEGSPSPPATGLFGRIFGTQR